jgi:hypothetical protein
MVDEAKFDAAGAMVPELPKFKHGFAIGNEVWVREQPTPYYRRHLLLHEGTHSYMQTIRGGLGPPWYAEGLAELLGTHRWEGGKLTLDWFPRSREEVPQLGRIKLVRDMVAAGRLMPLEQVLATPGTLNANNEPYAWRWALAALLDGTPAYRERFRKMPEAAASGQLEKRFRAAYADDWRELADQWEVFASTIEHGHDLERSAIRFAPGKPLAGSSTAVEVRVDLGWQSSGVELQAGRSYRLSASGRYQLGQKPQIWWCEPGGVTMRYHAGLPLGLVVGAIRPNEPTRGKPTPLAKPEPIGLGTTFTPHDTGTLYLRINDSPAELADNVGKVEVRVEAD